VGDTFFTFARHDETILFGRIIQTPSLCAGVLLDKLLSFVERSQPLGLIPDKINRLSEMQSRKILGPAVTSAADDLEKR